MLLSMILLVSGLTFMGCQQEGCTDPDARNYDSEADKDDGSCVYEGEAIFWTDADYGVGTIDVSVEGTFVGTITSYSNYIPDCGESGFVTITRDVGTYSFSAEAQDGTKWSGGSITINKNDCSTMRLYVSKSGVTMSSASMGPTTSEEFVGAPLKVLDE